MPISLSNESVWLCAAAASSQCQSVHKQNQCCCPAPSHSDVTRASGRASVRRHGLLNAVWRVWPSGESLRSPLCRAHVDCQPVRDWAHDEEERQSRIPFLICKMRTPALRPKSSGGFVKGRLTVHEEEMSTTVTPTIPSFQLTSDQLTVVAASCK